MKALLSPDSGDHATPLHVGVIMDGNGRWAKSRGLPRSLGHKRGAEAVREAVEAAIDAGVSYLTLYGFSSENWGRPEEEVNDLMGLLRHYLARETKELHKNGVRLRVIGEYWRFPADLAAQIKESEALTQHNSRMCLVLALSYGGRSEILHAVRRIAEEIEDGSLASDDLSEETIRSHFYAPDIPDPDLVIRTSGEMRISNFLLWQSAYAEFVFLDVLWPDFKKSDFDTALQTYHGRSRRYGGLG